MQQRGRGEEGERSVKVTYPVPIIVKQLHEGLTPEAPKLIGWLCVRSHTLLIETFTLMTF